MKARRAIGLGVLLSALTASAHDFQPGVVAFHETAPGRFSLELRAPRAETGPAPGRLEAALPDGCAVQGSEAVCDEALVGELAVRGMPREDVPLVVSVTRLSGENEEHVLTGRNPRVFLGRGRPAALGVWLKLGVEHVLTGFDHLAFVVAMVFVARGRRRLLITVTGFTLAHSLTLALAVKDVVRLPGPPVEACIAASIVLLAREALTPRETWTRRWPWAVSFLFGLVHGLGFAGALKEIGLPADGWIVPLALFNAGIEVGQLAVVALTLVLMQLPVVRWKAALSERVVLSAVGGAGAFWFLTRTADLIASR